VGTPSAPVRAARLPGVRREQARALLLVQLRARARRVPEPVLREPVLQARARRVPEPVLREPVLQARARPEPVRAPAPAPVGLQRVALPAAAARARSQALPQAAG